MFAALLVSVLMMGTARAADDAAGLAELGPATVSSPAVPRKSLKRFSDRVASGVGGALDTAGRATDRAITP